AQLLHHVGDRVLGQQHAAEHALLGCHVLWGCAVETVPASHHHLLVHGHAASSPHLAERRTYRAPLTSRVSRRRPSEPEFSEVTLRHRAPSTKRPLCTTTAYPVEGVWT